MITTFALTDLHGERVGSDERERSGIVEAAVPELLDVLIELRGRPPGRNTGELAVGDDGDQAWIVSRRRDFPGEAR